MKLISKELNKSANDRKVNFIRMRKIVHLNTKFILFLKKLDKKNSTIKSLQDLNNFLKNILKKKKIEIEYLKNFAHFWGKGTMQVSFIKY